MLTHSQEFEHYEYFTRTQVRLSRWTVSRIGLLWKYRNSRIEDVSSGRSREVSSVRDIRAREFQSCLSLPTAHFVVRTTRTRTLVRSTRSNSLFDVTTITNTRTHRYDYAIQEIDASSLDSFDPLFSVMVRIQTNKPVVGLNRRDVSFLNDDEDKFFEVTYVCNCIRAVVLEYLSSQYMYSNLLTLSNTSSPYNITDTWYPETRNTLP